MEGPNPNEIFQIEGGFPQDMEQLNGQLKVVDLSKKIHMRNITFIWV